MTRAASRPGMRWAGLLLGLLLASAGLAISLATASPAQAKMKKPITVYPMPKTPVASNATTFSFRGIKKKNLGPIVVTGKRSGRHRGSLLAHSDGRGVSFVPKRKFARGELVTVRTKRWIRGAKGGQQSRFWVRIGRFYGPDSAKAAPAKPGIGTLKSRPRLNPPVVDVQTFTPNATQGKVFFSPKEHGMTVTDRQGRIVWFRPVWAGGSGTAVNDFKVQRYRGKPVLTYFKNAAAVSGFSQVGRLEILNRNYKRIARFKTGNGYQPDIHEFMITPRNTALLLAYRGVRWNATKFGGNKNTKIMDNIVQEVDIKTGAVLFEWHSVGNVAIGESQRDLPEDDVAFDYFHANSVEWDGPNALLVSARGTSSIYRINRWNGNLLWIMRGMPHKARSSFKMGPGTKFGYQHDARRLKNGDITLFDNGSAGSSMPEANPDSSGMVLRLSGKGNNRTVNLVKRFQHPGGVTAGPEGSAESLAGNGMFVGWGGVSQMSEFDQEGNLTFDAVFHSHDKPFVQEPNFRISSYRAYKSPWHGNAPGRPALASEIGEPDGLKVWVSWNGASNVRSWRVMTGTGEDDLTEATTVPWANLETEIIVPGTVADKVQVEALDKDGNVLGRTALADPGTLAN